MELFAEPEALSARFCHSGPSHDAGMGVWMIRIQFQALFERRNRFIVAVVFSVGRTLIVVNTGLQQFVCEVRQGSLYNFNASSKRFWLRA